MEELSLYHQLVEHPLIAFLAASVILIMVTLLAGYKIMSYLEKPKKMVRSKRLEPGRSNGEKGSSL